MPGEDRYDDQTPAEATEFTGQAIDNFESMSTADIARARGMDLKEMSEAMMPRPVPPELLPPVPQAERDFIDSLRQDAALGGEPLRQQFLREAKKDPRLAVQLLGSTFTGASLLAEYGGPDSTTRSLALYHQRCVEAVAMMPLSEFERMVAEGAGKEFQALQRARAGTEMGMDLADMPDELFERTRPLTDEDREAMKAGFEDHGTVAPSMPDYADPDSPRNPFNWLPLPGGLKRQIGGYLGYHGYDQAAGEEIEASRERLLGADGKPVGGDAFKVELGTMPYRPTDEEIAELFKGA